VNLKLLVFGRAYCQLREKKFLVPVKIAPMSYFGKLFERLDSIFHDADEQVVAVIFQYLNLEKILEYLDFTVLGKKRKRKKEIVIGMRKRYKLDHNGYKFRNLPSRRVWSDDQVYAAYQAMVMRPSYEIPDVPYPCCDVSDPKSLRDDSDLSFQCELPKWKCGKWWHEKCLKERYGFSMKLLSNLKLIEKSFFCPNCSKAGLEYYLEPGKRKEFRKWLSNSGI